MKPASLTRSEAIIIAAAALIVGLAGTLAINSYLTIDHDWFPVVSPANERPVDILAVNRLLRVYVKTDQGNVYLCGGRSWRDACEPVRAADVPVVAAPGRWSNCTGAFPEPPPLAGSVVDSLEVGQCFEGRTFSKLVILADGTMWQWLRTYSWVNGFALASGSILSVLSGLLLGWLIVWLRRNLSEPAPRRAEG